MTEREIFIAAIERDDADQRAALLNEAEASLGPAELAIH